VHELVICPPDLPCRFNLWNIPSWAQIGLYVTMTVASLIMLIGLFRRIRLWRQGQPYPALNELPERVRRLFTYGFRQDRINRQPYSGLMHASIFWGFVTLFIGTALATVDADIALPLMDFKVLQGWFYEVYKLALDIAGLFFVVALGFALLRRYGRRFPRLGSERSFAFTLLLLLLINVTGFLIESLRLAVVQPAWSDWSIVGNAVAQVWLALGATEPQLRAVHLISWLSHFGLVAVFIAALPATNLFHLFTSPTNIFFSDPVRPVGALRPIPVEDVEKFGAETTQDFTWKQRLGFDACTYCGRCQSVCPAMASGTILSPKNVIVKLGFAMGVPTLNNADLMAAMPAGSHSNGHQNGKAVNLHGDIIQADEMWACTTCAACIWECPVYIEIIDDIIDMRRYLTMSEGNLPSGAASALTMIERTGNPWGYPLAERHDWAKGLGVPFLEPGQPVDYVFWVGCSMAYDARNQKIARSIVKILKQAGASVALLAEEQCNGDPARRLGNEYLYQAQAKTNIDNLKQYQFKTIMTGCPHCFNTIKNEYPQFGGDFQVVHHSQVIADLIKAGKIPLDAGLAEQITFHDSCYLGRYNNIFEAPREALAATGAQLLEMPRNREKGFCCGGGGGQIWMEVPAAQRINHLRMDEALTLNPSMVATACPFCMTMMDDAAKVKGVEETVAVKDFAEIIAERMK